MERKAMYIDVTQLPKGVPRGEKTQVTRFHRNLIKQYARVARGNRPAGSDNNGPVTPIRSNTNNINNMRANNTKTKRAPSTNGISRNHAISHITTATNQTSTQHTSTPSSHSKPSDTKDSETIHID